MMCKLSVLVVVRVNTVARYMMADEMRKDVMENIQDYLATQLMVHSNARTKMLRSRDSKSSFHDICMLSW